MAIDTFYTLTVPQGIVSGAPYGTPYPGDPTTAATGPSAPWYDFGTITTDGLTENPSQTRQSFKRWGSIATYDTVITDEAHTFQVKFLENNAAVLGLYYRTGSNPSPTGTTANEVQTVTISGAPTGGSFVLDYNGNPTPDIAYNASTSAVQTALQALPGLSGNVTVTGTPGSSYVLTFGGSLAAANVPQLTAANNLTGGTTPSVSVATTTGGASGSLLKITDDTTGSKDIRAFCFDLVQGTNHIRFYVPQGEVTARGNVTYKTDAKIEYDVTITAYPNAQGVAIQRAFLLDALRLGL